MTKQENKELDKHLFSEALKRACQMISEREETCPASYECEDIFSKCVNCDWETAWFGECWEDFFIQQASKGSTC